MKTWTVCFEFVSPEEHPQYYCRCSRTHPTAKAESIAAQHWTFVEVCHTNHPDAVAQFRNLKMLQANGEFIRRVSIASDEDVQQYVATR